MKAYVAAPDNAIKGILYNAVYNQSQEEIFEDLVALNPSRTFTIADARQLGRTKSILVTFINTTEVPRQLNFYGAVYSCHPFKAKVEACFNCRKPGHRADVCPKERTGLCPRCGIAHPVKPTPDCTPKCILCGGAHFTGTRRCKVRFDRSGNSSNNTAKSTTRTTPPASPPPVSPPESSRNSRSHHRSPSRSRSRSRTSSRQGRHRSRSVSFPPLSGQKDQNIEKQFTQRDARFKRDFEDHSFGHSCKVCERGRAYANRKGESRRDEPLFDRVQIAKVRRTRKVTVAETHAHRRDAPVDQRLAARGTH
ncbi:hypothetical protein HPB49_011250 [Dermacentor silvarum]|uniref:Uncharacterized protein n=1 Tax=Dermacentor silvarum TaxID=543639 RepID=A0ACB8DCI4_DERSI|nr:hypothetical protein HPB49_011250 [Dermacentor silvarum]